MRVYKTAQHMVKSAVTAFIIFPPNKMPLALFLINAASD